MLRAVAATTTRIGVETAAGPLIPGFGARTVMRIERLAAKYRGQR
jgi:hypothetical protein